MFRRIESQPPVSPLYGRDDIIEELLRSVHDLRVDIGGCVVVEGPPGIGKSRILEHVAKVARAKGVAVMVCRATELDALLPLAALSGTSIGPASSSNDPACEQATPELCRWRSKAASAQGNLFSLVESTATRIETWAKSRPALIALDDAHWADEMTMLILRTLVPAAGSQPVLWLLTRRPGVPGCSQTGIDTLLREGARLHTLGPIPRRAIAQMCAHILGAEPDPDVHRLAARCGGNPFLLEELLTAARDSGRIQVRDGRATVADDGLPENLVNVVDQHLASLSDSTRRMLSAASVLGRPFSIHEVAQLIGCAPPELLPATTEAINAAVLVSDGPSLAFRHELIREALYKGLPGAVRSALHREAASLRRCEGASPAESIEHLIRSGRLDTDDAIELLRQAVEETAPNAPNTAADMLVRALAVIDGREITQTAFIADAVQLLAEAGRFNEATSLAQGRLRGNLSPGDEALLLLRMSEALYLSGRHVAVVKMATHALTAPTPPREVLTDLLGIKSLALLETGAYAAADRAAKLALEQGDGEPYPTQACCRSARSRVAQARGDLDESLALAYQAVQIADDLRGEALNRHPRLALCQALIAADQLGEAEVQAERGRREAADVGGWARPHYQLLLAELRLAAGRTSEARGEALAGLREAERTGAVRPMVQLRALLSRLAVHSGQLDHGAICLNRVDQLLATADVGRRDEVSLARLEYYVARNRHNDAFDALASDYACLPRWPMLLVREPRAASHMLRLAQRLGRHAEARTLADAARALADQNPTSASLTGVAAHTAGLLHGDLDLLRQAAQRLQHSPRPALRAAVLEDLAKAESDAGRHPQAAELMREASVLYRCCGAQLDHARTEAHARRLRGSQQPRRRPRSTGTTDATRMPIRTASWDRLTDSELRVVRLVAKGLSNREVANRLCLSPHTVDSHLRHSFSKLGVSNRTELTRHVLTNDLDAERLN